MRYTSQNEEAQSRFVEPGDYTVTIIDAVEAVSKGSGAEMIKLKLEVEPQGVHLYDYLVGCEAAAWKIDAFRKSVGDDVQPDTESEINPRDLIGRQGRARLKIEEYDGRRHNKVEAWLTNKEPSAPRQETQAQKGGGDDPF